MSLFAKWRTRRRVVLIKPALLRSVFIWRGLGEDMAKPPALSLALVLTACGLACSPEDVAAAWAELARETGLT
jgi:hypothetical protein